MRQLIPACWSLALALSTLVPSPSRAAYKFFNPASRDSIPAVISGTGMYKDIKAKILSEDVLYFEVNAPLWTDGAAKSRYIVVPPGTSILYNDTADTYGYPDGAMVMKNFALDTVAGDPRTRILVETRFTALRKSGGQDKWYLFTYRWRRDQSDADLVSANGEAMTVRVFNQGLAGPATNKKWLYPSVPQCAACHRNSAKPGRVVLAFFTAQLNRPLAQDPSVNQLTRFFDVGLLRGVRPDLSRSPRWARYDESSASLELRSRSYLAANCSGCHGEAGIRSGATPNVTLDFDYHDLRVRTDLFTKKLFGGFPVDSPGVVVPGRPDRSVVIFRQATRNQKEGDFALNRFSMPPLGSYEPDTAALKVMTAWIQGMRGVPVHREGAKSGDVYSVRGGRIQLPARLVESAATPVLVDFRGRQVSLVPEGEGVWRIGRDARPGLHILLVEGRSAHRFLLGGL